MNNPSFEENNSSLIKFEKMLKTNQILFFDAIEFEGIIHYYIDFAQFNLAKKALKMSMEQHPQNIELMLLQSEIMLFDGSYNDAQVLLEQIEKLSPENEEIFLQRANISSKQKDHSKAIEFLLKALDITDERMEVWNLIGMEYLVLEDYSKAKDFCLELIDQKTNYFKFISDKKEVKLEEVKFIFLRQYPPFNMHYITSTFILDCLPKSTVVVNNPTSVRNAAEKIFPFEFKEFMPPTIIAQKVEQIKNFFQIHKDIITKPLYGNGGAGINRSKEDKLIGIDIDCEYLEMPIMAQKYIPEISEGDRRVIFFDGDYVGSVARIPEEGSIKANFHAGGSAKKTGLVFRDKQIIDKLGKELKKLDLFFVGIDIIGDYLTEINVTSPTGIKHVNKLNNVKLEQVFLDKLEETYTIV